MKREKREVSKERKEKKSAKRRLNSISSFYYLCTKLSEEITNGNAQIRTRKMRRESKQQK